jgi:hypothetical protein
MDADTSTGRRRLLMGAGAGLGALALASVPAAASAMTETQGNGQLTGSWLVTVTFGPLTPPIAPPPPPSTAVNSFAAGGVFAAIVLSPQAPAPALGTWEPTGDHTFKATLWQSSSVPGGPTFAIRVSLRGKFSDDHIEAAETYDLFVVPDLTTRVATGTSTSSGSRITA